MSKCLICNKIIKPGEECYWCKVGPMHSECRDFPERGNSELCEFFKVKLFRKTGREQGASVGDKGEK